QVTAGARAWRAADVLPFTAWISRLWRTALAAGVLPSPPALLDEAAARALWHTIVARHGRDWLNARGAARHAADAWSTFHRFRDEGETLAATVATALADDPVVFGEWASRYASHVTAIDAIDDAQLPDRLCELAHASWLAGTPRVVLHGFLSFTPQQRRVLAALRAAGVAIAESRIVKGSDAIRMRTAFSTARDELAHAFAYARDRLTREPSARVAIVVADLDERRSEALALADEALCPEHLLALSHDAPRPYGISLGVPLASMPIVTCALDMIALSTQPVEASVAASALRSPYLPDAGTQWTQRAQLEAHWLRLGVREVEWIDVLSALRTCDPSLHRRVSSTSAPTHTVRLPREWARAWSDWLAALGWPGNATLSSDEWQAREAWSAALARFASIATVTGTLSAVAAHDALRALLTETLFQPEAPPAQIQILGVLEAAGLEFDYAWLAGFDAQRWPRAAAPNPLLPLAWQRGRNVPRANAQTALTQAIEITSALETLAREIVVSHAATVDQAEVPVSPLFAYWPCVERSSLPRSARIGDAFAEAAIERVDDRRAPAIVDASRMQGGGAALFDRQSACPFQAYARHRLRVGPTPVCPDGLTAAERGEMLHATLKAFWDGVGNHAALLALDDERLSACIGTAVEAGRARIPASRWRALSPVVANAEATRLAATLRAWLDEGERPRPPFRVRAHELRLDDQIEGLRVSVRIDRIDELADGGIAIIDYKSGRVVAPTRWFGERPEGIQLAVYAHALESSSEEPIRALAYAQVKAGEIEVAGIVEDASLWPALVNGRSRRLPNADWQSAREALRESVVALAQDIRAGVADVSPRAASTCTYCGLHSLCRVRQLGDDAGAVEP
ncbi:MAG TPA: PD-(D/E)XK nuclease family protein, partial [Casimicrobiaceae bacterium]|nr:PD-(D/E)XK nuclease family protein [Casimicrobiaceae bacterium]